MSKRRAEGERLPCSPTRPQDAAKASLIFAGKVGRVGGWGGCGLWAVGTN